MSGKTRYSLATPVSSARDLRVRGGHYSWPGKSVEELDVILVVAGKLLPPFGNV